MSETRARVRETIPEEIMLGRLAQSEQMREFFIEMWMQNPALAKQGGVRVQALLTPLERDDAKEKCPKPSGMGMAKQRGISLVELIMFIVIVSTALAGILLVFNVTTKGSADPLIHKQALAAAESLLEEIQLQDFSPPSGVTAAGTVTQGDRASAYHIVSEYHTFATSGIFSVADAAAVSAVLANYDARVTVEAAALGDISASGSAVLITVTVTDPQGNDLQISGYRTDYCCSKVE